MYSKPKTLSPHQTGQSYSARCLYGVAFACMTLALSCHAEEQVLEISIQNHAFSTDALEAPAGQKFKLRVKNLDSTPEEFDSDDLHREKLVPAGKEILINLGPLKAGSYAFKGDFHPKTAHGTLIVH